jgi:hypothetical protein
MTGPDIAELDISSDGQRALIGQLVSTDPAGNRLWHLYMNVGGADESIDLMPGASGGALYDGMSADGTRVYMSTADGLTGDDTDSSVDIYRADVGADDVALTRISAGNGAGDTDSCDPSANTVQAHWNSLAPGPNCDALAIGGQGGVASADGRIFFLSPEALDAADPDNQPVAGAPNLYLDLPGSGPHFIRTLESSSNAPLPEAAHPYKRSIGAFTNPVGAAIDPSNGDSYVFDIGTEFFGGSGFVKKYDSEGKAALGFASNGTLTVSGVIGVFNLPVGIAVDPDPSSPNYRDLFVPNFEQGVRVYDPSGNLLFSLSAGGATAVAVDSTTGNIFVSSFFGGVSAFGPDGTPLGFFPTIESPTGVAAYDGRVYVANGGGPFGSQGTVEIYDESGSDLGQLDAGPARGVAADPSDGHVFVDRGNQVIEYDTAGDQVSGPTGSGLLSSSFSLAADEGRLVVTNRGSGNALDFGPLVTPPDPATDNPLVIHSLESASTRYPGDFQVTASGAHAVFASTLELTGYDNGGHSEVFRYDAADDSVDCTSCNPTGEQATGDATLPARGLGVTNDGRVFYNSTEGLVDRDLNEQRDAYEWKSEDGIQLISTGSAALGASLLGVSADGTDAFFFTREKLVNEDANGSRVKLYDARAGGGYPYVPPEIPCKASDECHGAGSAAPPAPVIGSVTGTPVGNVAPGRKCKPAKAKAKAKAKRKCGRHKHRKRKKHRRGGRK